MKNIYKLLMLTFLGLSIQLSAQNNNLPKNPEPGKCYVMCFYYEKEVEWKEVECSKNSGEKKEKTNKELIKDKQKKIKLVKYQEKLKSLGYNIKITGITDNETIAAHHKYLKIKRKEEKRRKTKKKD